MKSAGRLSIVAVLFAALLVPERGAAADETPAAPAGAAAAAATTEAKQAAAAAAAAAKKAAELEELRKQVASDFGRWQQEVLDFGKHAEQPGWERAVAGLRQDLEDALLALEVDATTKLADGGEWAKELGEGRTAAGIRSEIGGKKDELFAESSDRLRALGFAIWTRPDWFHIGLTVLVVAWLLGLAILVYHLVKNAGSNKAHPAGLEKGTIRSILATSIVAVSLLMALVQMLATYRVDATLAAAFSIVVAFYFGARAVESYIARPRPNLSYTTTGEEGEKEEFEAHDPAIAKDIAGKIARAIEERANRTGELAERIGELDDKVRAVEATGKKRGNG